MAEGGRGMTYTFPATLHDKTTPNRLNCRRLSIFGAAIHLFAPPTVCF
ncbi:MAG: hypothetical protein AVDCRST_MAG56-5360 [uncultured Cytophagales bacterium]|uniref:Uncharacterized protein n=1 Tax=uncultured Cytophagales bacterium TaxID=158755 RepID=A0A6J4KA48_9SPHI|nr:MAG: hypothetical protein AVDCRST_MAG56-5360 [uncultured Cytophagales bacterium]